MLFSYETVDHEMHLKSITSFVMMILLLGVSTSALQNSVFAQTPSTSDSDNDTTKRLGEIQKEKFKQEAKEKFKQEAKEKFKQEARDLRHEAPRPNCNPEDSDHARQELGAIEQRYGEIKAKYYEEWQRLHESGEYDGPWGKFAQEHFLNSPELSEMKNTREKYSKFFRNCNDVRETGPYQISPNGIREVRPYQVSPIFENRINCNPDDYLHAKKELAPLEQRYNELKTKYYDEWQRLQESGEYDGTWENFAKERFMNSPDMAEARQIHEKYSEFLRHCNQATDARPYPTDQIAPRTVCKENYEHAKKELAALEHRYGELKMKFYNEWQRLHESGDYDEPWEKFSEEKFLNSHEIADLNHMREKYHQLMMHCSNIQQEITEEDDIEETTSYDDLTDELEDEIILDDNLTDDLGEETTLDDDLDELLTEIESINIPESIKDEAGWWADNQIEDSEFASSIEYLGAQKIMQFAAPSGPDLNIPQWVKAIAAWWAEGKIPDKEFVNAVQFLVDNGIIKV